MPVNNNNKNTQIIYDATPVTDAAKLAFRQTAHAVPISVLAIALLSGSILVIPPLLQRHLVSSNTAWFLQEFWPVPAILSGYLTMRVFRLELAVDFFQIPLRDDWMIQLDILLFGQPVPLYLQHWITPGLTLWKIETIRPDKFKPFSPSSLPDGGAQ